MDEVKSFFIEDEEIFICPNCGEETDELFDTTEYINGGLGYCCEQCIEDGDMMPI